jgi:hypothetical protein
MSDHALVLLAEIDWPAGLARSSTPCMEMGDAALVILMAANWTSMGFKLMLRSVKISPELLFNLRSGGGHNCQGPYLFLHLLLGRLHFFHIDDRLNSRRRVSYLTWCMTQFCTDCGSLFRRSHAHDDFFPTTEWRMIESPLGSADLSHLLHAFIWARKSSLFIFFSRNKIFLFFRPRPPLLS